MPSHGEPKMRRTLRVLLLLFAVFVLVGVITVVTHRNSPTTPGATPPVNNTTTTLRGQGAVSTLTTTVGTPGANSKGTTTVGTPGPSSKVTVTTSAVHYLALSIQHAGDETVGPFAIATVTSQWDLSWTYKCPKLAPTKGFSYIVTFNTGARRDLNDLGPDEHAMDGSGVEHYFDAGTFKLAVTSECLWTIRVTEIGS